MNRLIDGFQYVGLLSVVLGGAFLFGAQLFLFRYGRNLGERIYHLGRKLRRLSMIVIVFGLVLLGFAGISSLLIGG